MHCAIDEIYLIQCLIRSLSAPVTTAVSLQILITMAQIDGEGVQHQEDITHDPLVEDELCDFEFIDENEEDMDAMMQENAYLRDLRTMSGLEILQRSKVVKAYEENGKLGLFRLFITREWFNTIRKWTNKKLDEKGRDTVNESKFDAYLGLEMAMSIVSFNDTAEYWRSNMFTGHSDFINAMSRDDFCHIRSCVVLKNPEAYDHDEASADPLHHSRRLIEHFMKNAAKIAVPIGTSALDENTARTKARSRAKSYLPSKPDKYGIRFYAVVGSKHVYLSSISDNGSGNHTNISQPQMYCRVFRELRTSYNQVFDDPRCPVSL